MCTALRYAREREFRAKCGVMNSALAQEHVETRDAQQRRHAACSLLSWVKNSAQLSVGSVGVFGLVGRRRGAVSG